MDADALEYKFGINGLLRGGAVVILSAILCLAAILVARGYVTPPVQFVGEILLCLSFAGIGVWKRNEREEFGQLMLGVSASGLYASFAGAHLSKHLFGGEVLVGLFVLLSLGNLAYASKFASKSFLALGMLGGFAAAMMPMKESKVGLDLALHFLIALPAAAIVLRQRWYWMAIALWGISSLSLLPIVGSSSPDWTILGAIYANFLLSGVVVGRTFEVTDFDPKGALPGLLTFGTGAVGLAVAGHSGGALHVLAFSALAALVGGFGTTTPQIQKAIVSAAAFTFVVLFPVSFPPPLAAALYGAMAVIIGLFALRFERKSVLTLALIAFTLSIAAYAIDFRRGAIGFPKMGILPEIQLVTSWAVSVILTLRFAYRKFSSDALDITAFIGSGLLVAFFTRFIVVTIPVLPANDSARLGLGTASLLLTIAARQTRTPGIWMSAGITMILALAFVFSGDSATTPLALSISLIAIGAVNLSVGRVGIGDDQPENVLEPVRIGYGAVLSALFSRLVFLVGSSQGGTTTGEEGLFVSFAVLNLIWTVLAFRLRRPDAYMLGWIAWGLCSSVATIMSVGAVGNFMLSVSILTLIVHYWITPRKPESEGSFAAFCSISLLVLCTILGTRLWPSGVPGSEDLASVTTIWVIVSTLLMVAGFRFERRHLRYAGLSFFGLTLGKVLLFDLANVDAVVRVGILFLLGIGMLGAGIWYLKWNRKAPPQK